MDEKNALVEFLSQPDNMRFLLELEHDKLISKAKAYKYERGLDYFVKKYITPSVWPGYTARKVNTELRLINNRYNEERDFYIYVDVNTNSECDVCWYGVNGSLESFNRSDFPEAVEFHNRLTNDGLTIEPNRGYGAYNYFKRERIEFLTIPDDSLDLFFSEWKVTFWEFANNIRNAIEKVNSALALHPKSS